ncbi:unnamed protein product, partial [Hapterophycus canaliculatus]
GRGGGKNRTDSSRRAHAAAGSARSAFVSLSGELPGDEEQAGPNRNYYNKDVVNAQHERQRRPNGGRAPSSAPAAAAVSKNTSTRGENSNEPGWAGADRAAGWG